MNNDSPEVDENCLYAAGACFEIFYKIGKIFGTEFDELLDTFRFSLDFLLHSEISTRISLVLNTRMLCSINITDIQVHKSNASFGWELDALENSQL